MSILFLFFVFTSVLGAQQIRYEFMDQEASPLKLSVVEERWIVPYLSLTIENSSQKEVMAYVVSVHSRYSADTLKLSSAIKLVKFGSFAAGNTWNIHKVYPTFQRDKTTPPCVIAVDYVLFTDMSEWGPDTLKHKAEIKAHLSLKGVAAAAGRAGWAQEAEP